MKNIHLHEFKTSQLEIEKSFFLRGGFYQEEMELAAKCKSGTTRCQTQTANGDGDTKTCDGDICTNATLPSVPTMAP